MLRLQWSGLELYNTDTQLLVVILFFALLFSPRISVAVEDPGLGRPTSANQKMAGQRQPWSDSTRCGLRWEPSERRLVPTSTTPCGVASVHSTLRPSTKPGLRKRERDQVGLHSHEPILMWHRMRNGRRTTGRPN